MDVICIFAKSQCQCISVYQVKAINADLESVLEHSYRAKEAVCQLPRCQNDLVSYAASRKALSSR